MAMAKHIRSDRSFSNIRILHQFINLLWNTHQVILELDEWNGYRVVFVRVRLPFLAREHVQTGNAFLKLRGWTHEQILTISVYRQKAQKR